MATPSSRTTPLESENTAPTMHTRYDFLPYAIIVFFTLFYAWAGINRHAHFESNAYDLGIFTQVVWHDANMETPASSIREVPNILGDHFQPFLVILAPFMALAPSPITLILLQACVLGSGALPLYRMAKDATKNTALGIAIVFSYFMYLGTQQAMFFDIHPITFAAGLLPWWLFAFERKRPVAFVIFTLLLLSTKETIGLTLAPLATALACARRLEMHRRIALLVTAVLAILASAIAIGVVIPAFGNGTYAYTNTYNHLGDAPMAIIATLARYPVSTATMLVDTHVKRETLTTALTAFAFLSIGAPLIAAATFPTFAAQLLAKPELAMLWTTSFHYYVLLAPILAYASIRTLARIERRSLATRTNARMKTQARRTSAELRTATAPAMNAARFKTICACAIIGISVFTQLHEESPIIRAIEKNIGTAYTERRASKRIIQTALENIPYDASVTATDSIVSHLALRNDIRLLNPKQCTDTITPAIMNTEYVVINTTKPHWPLSTTELEETIHTMIRCRSYDLIIHHAEIMIFKRRE